MKKRAIIIFLIVICILSLVRASVARAQGEDLSLNLALPNEGETFYAGPSSLLYMIPISGWLESGSFSPDQVSVDIAIYQKESLVTSVVVFPEPSGKFEIYAEVNPGASTVVFAAEYIPCGDVCHFNEANQFQKDDWIASMELPPGQMKLMVTATDPAGRTAVVERNIIVDRSNYAIVPVQIVLVDNQPLPVENIPVTGTTWLYMWRSRFVTGGTDASGVANVNVEALAEAPTTYRFQVMPTVMDGALYESIAPVEIILPPGASEGPPVTLQVRRTPGSIRGKVNGEIPLSQMQIWAVRVPEGDVETALVSSNGSFVFENIPIDKYVITTDSDLLATTGFELADQNIDLTRNMSTNVELNPDPLEGYSCQGYVMDTDGNKLPFAWVSIEKLDTVGEVMPGSGQYDLYGLPAQKATLVANAPGYYSLAQVYDPSLDDYVSLDFVLTRRPDTQSIQWGDGEIVAPSETRISSSGQHIFLERGWLWGVNQANDPIIIQVGGVEINLSSGKFALEDVSGQISWFYLFEGNGSITTTDGTSDISIQAGQMIALDNVKRLSAVPYDPVVVKAFHPDNRVLVSTIIEPTFRAQLVNRLALIGIDFVKLITFITYGFIVISVILFPVLMLFLWGRKKLIHNKEKRI